MSNLRRKSRAQGSEARLTVTDDRARRAEPPRNLRSLQDRLRAHARRIDALEIRVQRRLAALVVNEIFLQIDLGMEGPPVLVKGGTAIDLRRGLAPARLSKDWDAAVRGNLDEFIEAARVALVDGWGGFVGRLVRENEIDVPGLAVKPRRFEVKLDFRGRPFATVPVELSPAEGLSGDEYDRIAVPEYGAIGLEPAGPVYCLSLRYQIAQKIHACTDSLDGVRENDRARDLVDLQLLVTLLEASQLPALREACVEIFAGRQRHSWPPSVRVWESWPRLYNAASQTLGGDVLDDVDEAARWLREVIETIDDASATVQ